MSKEKEPRLKATEENSPDVDEVFEDTQIGEIVTNKQTTEKITKYSDYQVVERDGKKVIHAMPDFDPDNNLD